MMQWFRRLFKSAAPAYSATLSPFRDYVHPKGVTAAQLLEQYVGWVYDCVSLNAHTAARVPLRVYSRQRSRAAEYRSIPGARKAHITKAMAGMHDTEDAVEILEGPLVDLLCHINPHYNRFDWLELWATDLQLCAQHFDWIMFESRLGLPVELWPLPVAGMRIVPDAASFIKGYEMRDGPRVTKYSLDEIIYTRIVSPFNQWLGYGPGHGVYGAAQIGKNIETYQTSLLQNMGVPEMWIKMLGTFPKGDDDAELRRLLTKFKQAFGGPTKSGKTLITDSSTEEVKRLGFTPKELDLKESDLANVRKTAAGFGAPLSMLLPDDANRAISIEGRKQHALNTIWPLLARMHEKLNEQLVPYFGERLFVCFDSPVETDRAAQLAEDLGYVGNGVRLVNEVRAREGDEPVEGGDEPPWARAMALAEASRPMPGEPMPPDRPAKTVRVRHAEPGLWGACGCADCKVVDTPWVDASTEERQIFNAFARDAKSVLAEQRSDVVHRIQEGEPTERWLFESGDWDQRLAEMASPYVRRMIVQAGTAALLGLKLDIGFDVENPYAIRYLETEPFKFAAAVNKRTVEDLRAIFEDAIRSGASIPAIKQIIEELPAFGVDRSERIARTEMSRAMNGGTELGYIESGVVLGKQWLAAGDSCEFCLAMEDRYGPGSAGKSLGEDFLKQGDELVGRQGGVMHADYDDVPTPPAHPNCRCTLIAVLA